MGNGEALKISVIAEVRVGSAIEERGAIVTKLGQNFITARSAEVLLL